MEKIFITVFLVASSILYSECRSRNNSFISGILSPNQFSCTCNFGNKPTVPEIYYKKEKHRYERLVVYLYRNKQNNEVLIHIPDSIKQKHLPDINYEKNDILKPVKNEKIVDILQNYRNHIINYNPSVVSTTTPKIYNKDKIPSTPGKKVIQIPPSKVDHSKNLPVQIPSDKGNGDSNILYIYPQDQTKNQNKPVPIKKLDNNNHGVGFIPIDTELPTDIHFPNYVNSKPKPTIINHPHAAKNKTNNKVKYPEKHKVVPDKPYDIIRFPDHVKPISPEDNNFNQKPSFIPPVDRFVQRPSKYPINELHDVSDISVKIPLPKKNNFHDHDYKHHTYKPEPFPYWKKPSNVDPPKKNPGLQIDEPYDNLIDIIINYPQLIITPNGKDAKSPSKIEKLKDNKAQEITVDAPIFYDRPSTKDRVPILRDPTSTGKHNQFDKDTSDIYYFNPDKEIHIPETNRNNDRLDLPIPGTDIPQIHTLPGPIYIPGHIPNNRDLINIDIKKPSNDELLCNYCSQNRIIYNHGPLTYIGYKTFDQWFREEMYGFRHNKYDIDVNWVGEYIIKTLNENGLHISKKGFLTDSTGKVLRWQNLKLRAMLVGDALNLDKISKTSNPEYLAFIILTSIDPPKNLGIIPLGRTVLPYSTASLQSLSKIMKPNKIDFYDKINPKVRTNGFLKRSPNEYDKSVERFLNTLPYHSQDNNAIFDDDVQKKNSDKNKHNHDYINSEDLFGNDDMLRIIGGSAATGSGTPVSSKGRFIKFDA